MTPDALRAEAQQVAAQLSNQVFAVVLDADELIGLAGALVAFALQYAEHVEKRARLEGRIMELEKVHYDFAWCSQVPDKLMKLRAELAVLECGEKEAG